MKLQQLSRLGAALVLSLTSLLAISIPLAHAAGGFTCNWTGAGDGVNFSDSANWDTTTPGADCNGAAPQAGDNDNLGFDVTGLAANANLSNDISGLSLGDITFSGISGSNFTYAISGDAIILTDGIEANAAGEYDLTTPLTILGDQTFSSATSSDDIQIDAALSGTDNIAKTGAGTLLLTDASGYTGTITASGGDVDLSNTGTFTLGGSLVVTDGASVLLDNEAGADVIYNVPLTVSGNGDGAVTAINVPGATNFNQTLASPVVLASNVLLSGSDGSGNGTVTITGPLSGGFTLGVQSGQTVKLVINSSNNTSSTPNTSSGASVKTPGTPNTGFALVTGRPVIVLATTSVAAASLLFAARRIKTLRR